MVDLATGQVRRLYAGTRSVAVDNDFMTFLEGKPHVYAPTYATLPTGGADGIMISPDSSRVYWTTLSGRRLFSTSTAILAAPVANERNGTGLPA